MTLEETLQWYQSQGANPAELETIRQEFGPSTSSIELEQPRAQRASPDEAKRWLDHLTAKGATPDEMAVARRELGIDSELTNYDPTVRDRLGGIVQDTSGALGMSNQAAGNLAKGITGSAGTGTEQLGALDFAPGLSNFMAKQDADRDFAEGDNVGGVLNTTAAALGPAGKLVTSPLQAATKPTVNRLAQRADDINAGATGTPVTVPRVMDPEPSALSKGAASLARPMSGVPVVGTPLGEGVHASRQALDKRVLEEATRAGPASAGPDVAGGTAGDAAREWMRTTTKDEVTQVFEHARSLIPKDYRGQLPALAEVAKKLKADDAMSFSTANQPVIDAIDAALSSPGGITVEGAEKLRQILSKQANPGAAIATNATAEPGFKRAAGALGTDIKNMILEAGGPKAHNAARAAKLTFQKHKKTRNAVEKFLGKGAKADVVSGERLISRMHGAAKGTASGDVNSLLQLRKAMGKEEWETASRAVSEKLGMNARGEMDGLTWAKNYQKLSKNGKKALFSGLTKDYDKIADFATDFVTQQSRLGNPSRSGDLAAGVGLATWAVNAGVEGAAKVVLKVMGARRFMRFWGEPRVIRAVADVADAGRRGVSLASANAVRIATQALAIELDRAGGDGQAIINEALGNSEGADGEQPQVN